MGDKNDSGTSNIASTATNAAAAALPLVIAFGLVACVLYGVGAGMRSDIGILVQPLATQCGIAYADVSLCVAVVQVVFGAAQPVFGIVASRRSNRLRSFWALCLWR